ncbi:hypothetical protein PYW08_011360 [Mythimna loreyi]|uniref:Uncharacterized protein n=1 Tax=Mythimna loreyi TaxID=667449 RepID=A0ACC2Q3B6_9NEOP|nr:hypothetical protein PYW08_011360 [Mythimna loreyi]
MCRPLIFIVLQVLLLQYGTAYPYTDYIIAYIPVEELAYLLPQSIQAIPVPWFNSGYYFDPWYYQSMMMQNMRSIYQTTGPVTFGGKVKEGNFGNQGHGTITSYSAPPTPQIVTPEPTLPTSNSSTPTSLPNITTLPEVSLPSTTVTQTTTFSDPMPSTESVSDTPMSFVTCTSSQAIPYGVPNRVTNIVNNVRGMPHSVAMNSLLPNGVARNIPIAANSMLKGNIINHQNLATPYYKNANNVVYTNPKVQNANLANILENKLANDIATTALENFANTNLMTNVATSSVVANIPNGATYNFGNAPIPVTVTGVTHGNHPVGINILADNLEVKGLVSVVGRMPIFGAVALNGNVPSEGKASVNYGCGSPATV